MKRKLRCGILLLLSAVLFAAVPLLRPAAASEADTSPYYNIKEVDVSIEVPYGRREAEFTGKVANVGFKGYDVFDFSGTDQGRAYYYGISWYDETTGVFLKPGDVFVTGRTYTLRVILQADKRSIFSTKQVSDSLGVTTVYDMECTVNGEKASQKTASGQGAMSKYMVITRIFRSCAAAPADISTVNVIGINTPFDGGHPDYEVQAVGPHYTVETDDRWEAYSYTNGVAWIRHYEDDRYTYNMSAEDYFGRNTVYSVQILLRAEYPYRFSVNSAGKHVMIGKVKGYRCEILPMENRDPREYCILKLTFPA